MGANAVRMSNVVAGCVGLHSSDLECLELLHLSGSTTAGRLASHTGLTSGAITAVIDRLERAGFVHRRRDRNDRRVVLVEVVPSRAAHIGRHFEAWRTRWDRVNARYSDDELATVADYLVHVLDAGEDFMAWLEQQPCAAGRRRPLRAATGGAWLDEPAPPVIETPEPSRSTTEQPRRTATRPARRRASSQRNAT